MTLSFLPFALFLTAFITSGLRICRKCVTNSAIRKPGFLTFNSLNSCSVGLVVSQVSKLLKIFLDMSNCAARDCQFFKPTFCMSNKNAISPMTSGLMSNRLLTNVSSVSKSPPRTTQKTLNEFHRIKASGSDISDVCHGPTFNA